MNDSASRTIVIAVVGTLIAAGLVFVGKTMGTKFSESQYSRAVGEMATDESENGFVSRVANKIEFSELEEHDYQAIVNSLLESKNRTALLNFMFDDNRFKGADGADGADGANGLNGLSLPIGSVIAWPGATEAALTHNENWEFCDGREVKYNSELWGVLNGMYGNRETNGDERDIILPDFQGQFLRGATDDRSPGSKQSGQVGSHTHPIFGGTQRENAEHITNGDNVNDHPAWAGSFGGPAHYEIKAASTDDQFGHTYSNNGKETRPENIGVIWLIRVK